MANLLKGNPLYIPLPNQSAEIVEDKGERILDGMLLEQYQNSKNLKEYFMAFFSEMDYLYKEIQEVYLGRFLENAVGSQLDIVGTILGQNRAVILPTAWFGFLGAVDVDGFADKATPNKGGIFRDAAQGEGEVVALSDAIYKKLLMAKAQLINRDSIDIELAYHIIIILLGRVPSTLKLSEYGSEGIEKKRVDLLIARSEVSAGDLRLISYMAKYFIPNGLTFTITQVN